MAEQQDGPPEGELSRRDFMRGAAVTGIAVVGSSYVKPVLKLAGTTSLASAVSRPIQRPPVEDDDHDEHSDANNSGTTKKREHKHQHKHEDD